MQRVSKNSALHVLELISLLTHHHDQGHLSFTLFRTSDIQKYLFIEFWRKDS